jgi:hypothetical protein
MEKICLRSLFSFFSQLTLSFAVMIAGCAVVMAGNVWYISTHEHAHGTPKEVPYMHIRSKPFPWACNDCELFNGDCWKEARGEATSHGH